MELGSAARWGNREACGAPTGQASMGRDGLRGQRVHICMHALRCVCRQLELGLSFVVVVGRGSGVSKVVHERSGLISV